MSYNSSMFSQKKSWQTLARKKSGVCALSRASPPPDVIALNEHTIIMFDGRESSWVRRFVRHRFQIAATHALTRKRSRVLASGDGVGGAALSVRSGYFGSRRDAPADSLPAARRCLLELRRAACQMAQTSGVDGGRCDCYSAWNACWNGRVARLSFTPRSCRSRRASISCATLVAACEYGQCSGSRFLAQSQFLCAQLRSQRVSSQLTITE